MVDERSWTRGLRRWFPAAGDEHVALGDDAAVLPHRGRDTVVCCDPVIEDVHFTAATPARLVGRKAVCRNLSDLAAMGAVADWLLVSLVLPKGYPAARRQQLVRGVQQSAADAGCTVVGGDVAVHEGPLIVTVTALGHTAGRRLRRDALQVGDTLHVTGPLGGAPFGEGHLRFEPALAAGQALGRSKVVGGCMDVSDGLVLDLATMLAASGGLGAELDARAIPISAAARRAAARSGRAPLDHALRDGEDHVLLFSVRRGARLRPSLGLPDVAYRPIGSVVPRVGIRISGDGEPRTLSAEAGGYQHDF